MKKEMITRLTKNFEESAHTEQGVEFWMARDIQVLLEYNEWRNFLNVIEKAKTACKNFRQPIEKHFVDVIKIAHVGSEGDTREIHDRLSITILLLELQDNANFFELRSIIFLNA